jgi:hypothetical protein
VENKFYDFRYNSFFSSYCWNYPFGDPILPPKNDPITITWLLGCGFKRSSIEV